MISRPASGPSASATATARFSSTTGDWVRRTARRREQRPAGQSIGSPACSAAIAAWTTYGPRPWSANARSSAARPALELGIVPELPVLISAGAPGRRRASRASRRASTSSISATRPCTSGSSGISVPSASPEPDRLGSELAPAAVALVEHEIDDREDRCEPVRQQMVGGTRNGMPAARIFCFARTSRCAIVGSGTRNARAISLGRQARRACAGSARPARRARAPDGST